MAVQTQGKGSVLVLKAVESQDKGSVFHLLRQRNHKTVCFTLRKKMQITTPRKNSAAKAVRPPRQPAMKGNVLDTSGTKEAVSDASPTCRSCSSTRRQRMCRAGQGSALSPSRMDQHEDIGIATEHSATTRLKNSPYPEERGLLDEWEDHRAEEDLEAGTAKRR